MDNYNLANVTHPAFNVNQATQRQESDPFQLLRSDIGSFLCDLSQELRQEQTTTLKGLSQTLQQNQSPENPWNPTADETTEDKRDQTSQPARRAIKIPDPTVFTGSREDLPRWIAQMRIKFRINDYLFPDETSRLGYAFSRLESLAVQQMLPFFTSESQKVENVKSLFRTLENAFGDPDRKATAQAKL